MKPLNEIGMVDVASRPKKPRAWLMVLIALVVLGVYVAFRNYQFVQAGMLRPNFAQIHRAYDFNLWELPWTLAVLSALLFVMGRIGTSRFYWIAGLYLFIAADLFLLRYWVTHVEPNQHVVRNVRIATPKLTQPIRLLHVADIQSGAIGDKEEALFELIDELEPDIILNTGDYIQAIPPLTTNSELPKLIQLKGKVNPRYGTYGVYGDTDYLLFRFRVEDFKPMQMLSSATALVETEAGMLSLHGLSLHESENPEWAQRSVERWLEQSSEKEFRILLGHSPNYALGMAEQPIDLCLAGHTHGGQVKIPFYGALITYSDIPRQWADGFRRIGVPYLNVSAGAGSNRFNGLPPMRFNCPTEITLIELVPLEAVR
ncbi:MAG: metallophosphoesterase [Coraliomargarita sp.]